MYLKHLSQRSGGTILGRPVEFVYEFVNTTETPVLNSAISKATIRLLTNGTNNASIDFVICPPGDAYTCSFYVQEAKLISILPYGVNTVSYECMAPLSAQPPCTEVGQRRFYSTFGIPTLATRYFENFIGLIATHGAKSVAIVYQIAPTSMSALQGVTSSAQDYHLDVITIGVLTDTAHLPRLLGGSVLNATEQLITQNPGGVVLIVVSCGQFLNQFKQLDYFPPALSAINCADTGSEATYGDDIKYMTAPDQWNEKLTGAEYSDNTLLAPNFPVTNSNPIPSALQFSKEWQVLFGAPPNVYQASGMASITFLENALLNANSTTDYTAILKAMNEFYAPSFWGILSSNRFGENQQKQMVLIQRDQENMVQLVAPLSSATSNFIYPAPKWSERVYVHAMYATKVERIFIGFVAASTLILLLMMAMLIVYRRHPSVRATSPAISLVMVFGGLTSIMGIIVWPIENNTATCSTRVWVWTLGFHLFMDPLIAKSYRIIRIFSAKQLTVTARLSTKRTIFEGFMISIPQWILNVIWFLIDRPHPFILQPDILRPAFNTTGCYSSVSYIFVPLSFSYSLLCLLIGCIIAYKVRQADEMFNDSKSLAICIYTFSITAIVIGIIEFSTAGSASTLFIVRSSGILLAILSSLLVLLGDRILQARKEDNVGEHFQAVRFRVPLNKTTQPGPGPDPGPGPNLPSPTMRVPLTPKKPSSSDKDSPDMQALRSHVAALETQIAKLEHWKNRVEDLASNLEFSLPQLPESGRRSSTTSSATSSPEAFRQRSIVLGPHYQQPFPDPEQEAGLELAGVQVQTETNTAQEKT